MHLVPLGRSALILAAVLFSAPAVALAAPADNTTPEAPRGGDKVRKALLHPITLKLENKSLSAAIDALKDAAKMNIVLDSAAIQQLGYTPDMSQPISIDLKDAPVRTVLREILDPFGLTYVVIDNALIVTTEDMAMMRQMRQHVTVDMDKVDLGSALRQVARDAGVNVLVDSRVEKDADAKVTLHLEDVPLETAVRLLAEMANLKLVRIGNVLFVTSKDNANELRQDPDLNQPPQPPSLPKENK